METPATNKYPSVAGLPTSPGTVKANAKRGSVFRDLDQIASPHCFLAPLAQMRGFC